MARCLSVMAHILLLKGLALGPLSSVRFQYILTLAPTILPLCLLASSGSLPADAALAYGLIKSPSSSPAQFGTRRYVQNCTLNAENLSFTARALIQPATLFQNLSTQGIEAGCEEST